MWHDDTFLYRQADGSFAGNDYYFDYAMTRTAAEDGTAISFSVDNETRNYRIVLTDNGHGNDVKIYEDGVPVFDGSYDGWGFLLDKDGLPDYGISVTFSNEIPKAENSFPSHLTLYGWAETEETEIHGTTFFIIPILLLAAYILIDIRHPEFFFRLRYAFAWDLQHAEPSDWYYTGQRIGRVLCVVGIVVCMIMTFVVRV